MTTIYFNLFVPPPLAISMNYCKLSGLKLLNHPQIFEPMEPSSYTSITLYNIGAIAMERSATVGVSNDEEREAESFLQMAATHWNHQNLNTTARMLPRVYNRLIGLYLKSSPNTAPNLDVTVSQDNLRRAGEVIRSFDVLLPQCPKWMKSTFYLGKADHYIRSRDIDDGKNDSTIIFIKDNQVENYYFRVNPLCHVN